MSPIDVELIGKPGCHLCDDAREVVIAVLAELESSPGGAGAATLREVSILDDAGLHDEFWEEIPVVRLNGRVHNYWRIDPVRLRTALDRLAAEPDASKEQS